jgi:hypothetical protein
MNKKSAKGTKGFLLDVGGSERYHYVFRVYNENKTYLDYKIHHDDLFVEIIDASAILVTKDGLGGYIDYDLENVVK